VNKKKIHLPQKFDKKKGQKFPAISQLKNPLEKHCPRPASRKKRFFKNPAKSLAQFQTKNSRAKCSPDVHEIFNDFAEFTE
jgi:hypothetical protein